ncbi:hypothetical protein BJX99DRAFT_238826, partial [Aspergillus californicus]
MADVRSLLRSELASRKGSPQSNTPNRVTKKRKVDPTETITRKKVRHTNPDQILANAQIRPPSAQVFAGEDDDVEALPQDVHMKTDTDTDTPTQPDVTENIVDVETTTQTLEPPSILISPVAATADTQAVDEDEWAAFEREVAAPSRVPQKPAAVAAAATISAAPVTAEELAALQDKDNEIMKRNREAEVVEGEREDAARLLEEEFDEMEQLEERVRRLKHMREQLRTKQSTESAEGDEAAPTKAVPPEQLPTPAEVTSVGNKDSDEDEDEDDEDDDWDNWRF